MYLHQFTHRQNIYKWLCPHWCYIRRSLDPGDPSSTKELSFPRFSNRSCDKLVDLTSVSGLSEDLFRDIQKQDLLARPG